MAKNIFANKKRDSSLLYRLLLPLIAFVAVISIFITSLGNMETRSYEQQRMALEGAITKGIVHSYATSGYYPPSLQYILDKYQIIYNSDIFYIDYQPIGSNIMPDLTIITLR
jgi:hypothetical protein